MPSTTNSWLISLHEVIRTTIVQSQLMILNELYFLTEIILLTSFVMHHFLLKITKCLLFSIHILIKQNSNIKQNHSLSYFLIFINKFKTIDWKK